jgi:hypothetical protein
MLRLKMNQANHVMKNLVLFFPLLFISLFICKQVYSQDLIVGKNLTRTKCEIIGEDSIKIYAIVNHSGSQVSTYIYKDEVKSYHYDYIAQKSLVRDSIKNHQIYEKALTIGVLNGGGSLVGLDIEFALINSIGLQAGIGFLGIGGGINYHFRPDIRSSFISLQYYHQGIMDTYTQSLIGPSFVYRARKVFTASLGIGFSLEKGPAWPDTREQPKAMLTYSIGIYFPH